MMMGTTLLDRYQLEAELGIGGIRMEDLVK
jgi:hypothetical protein